MPDVGLWVCDRHGKRFCRECIEADVEAAVRERRHMMQVGKEIHRCADCEGKIINEPRVSKDGVVRCLPCHHRQSRDRMVEATVNAVIDKDWCMRMAKLEDGQEIGAGSPSHPLRQVDIRRASFRVLHGSPGHVAYGVWLNGAKSGDLVVRQEERTAFEEMMQRAGFILTL